MLLSSRVSTRGEQRRCQCPRARKSLICGIGDEGREGEAPDARGTRGVLPAPAGYYRGIE
jgi:hypothetical protein